MDRANLLSTSENKIWTTSSVGTSYPWRVATLLFDKPSVIRVYRRILRAFLRDRSGAGTLVRSIDTVYEY